jgi:hypothetical protein
MASISGVSTKWQRKSVFQEQKGDSKMKRRSMAKAGYILAAGASLVVSVSLWFTGNKEQGAFVGLWVPSILSLGSLMLSGGRDE